MPTAVPLVGREEELEDLLICLQQAKEGKGSVVLISGEAGIGKSRLVDELSDRARSIHCRTILGRCIPGSSRPYHPFEEAFQVCSKNQKIARLMFGKNETASGAPSGSFFSSCLGTLPQSTGNSEKVFFKVLELIDNIARHRPLLIIIEDVHWADSASIQLLQFLARNVESLPVLIVATYRPEDLCPIDGSPHPLSLGIDSLRKEGLEREIRLERIRPLDTSRMIESMLGGPAEESVTKRIIDDSRGNPLYAQELTKLLLSTASVVNISGKWSFAKDVPADIPPTVKEVMMRRVERLPGKTRRVLECASAVGDTFDPDLLEDVLCLERPILNDALINAKNKFSMIQQSGEAFCFEHNKLRTVIYEQISKPRRRELHKCIGLAVEQRQLGEGAYSQLAFHFGEGGVPEKCAHYSLLSAKCCLRQRAMQEAIPLLKTVLQLNSSTGSPHSSVGAALEGLGDAFKETGRLEEAVESYEGLLGMGLDGKDRARILWKEAECWHSPRLGKGSFTRFSELLDQAEGCGEIRVEDSIEIDSARALIYFLNGDMESSGLMSNKAEEALRRTENKERLILELLNHTAVLQASGDISKAAITSKEITSLLSFVDNPYIELHAYFILGTIHFHLGNVDAAIESIDRSDSFSLKLGDHIETSWHHIYKGLIALSVDATEIAQQEAVKAQSFAQRSETPYVITIANSLRAMVEALLGYRGEARRWYDQALVLMEGYKWSERSLPGGFMSGAGALTAWVEGARADDMFQESINQFRGGINGYLFVGMVQTLYGRYLASVGRKGEAEDCLKEALRIYQHLGNPEQSGRILKLLEEAERVK